MNRKLLTALLAAQAEITRDGDTFTAKEEAHLSILLSAANGGPTPLPRVTSVTLEDEWVEILSADERYCLPYDLMAGIKLKARSEGNSRGRAGFTA